MTINWTQAKPGASRSHGLSRMLIIGASVALGASSLLAAEDIWNGGGGADTRFSTAANWSLGKFPGKSDQLSFKDDATGKTVTFDREHATTALIYFTAKNANTQCDSDASPVDPVIWEATSPEYGIKQSGVGATANGFVVNNNVNNNAALEIRSGTYSVSGYWRVGNIGVGYLAIKGGTATANSDFRMAENTGKAAVVVGGGDANTTAVLEVNKAKTLYVTTSSNAGGGRLTIKAGGTVKASFLNAVNENSTLVLDGGTLIKTDDLSGNVGYLYGTTTLGKRKFCLTANGGTLDLQKDATIYIPLAFAEGAESGTLRKRGPGKLVLASVANGVGLVIEDGTVEVASGTLAALEIAGGSQQIAKLPAHAGRVSVTGGQLVLPPVDGTTIEEGVPVATGVNVNDFEFADGLSYDSVFTAAPVVGYTFTLSVDGTGALWLVPQAAGTVTWIGGGADGNWSTAGNWLGGEKPQTGSKVRFDAAGGETTMDIAGLSVNALFFPSTVGAFSFDGLSLAVQESITNNSTAAQTFLSPLALGAGGEFAVHTAGSMSFADAAVSFTELKKSGAGELTIKDSTLHAAPNVTVSEGALHVLPTSEAKTKSDGTGSIRVANGAQLILDVNNGTGNISVVEPMRGKTVYVEGDGDGRGAIVNLRNTDSTGDWAGYFSHLVVTGDASIGGGHIGVWPNASSGIADARAEGPGTLTLKTVQTAKFGFTFCGAQFALGGLVNEGKMQFQDAVDGTITNGVTLADGSETTLYKTTVSSGISAAVAPGATVTLKGQSNTSTLNGAFTVPAGSTLAVTGDKPVTFNGPVINNGTIQSSGYLQMNGPLSGDGTIASSGNTLDFMQGFSTNGFTGTFSAAGTLRFGSGGAVPTEIPAFTEMLADIDFPLATTTVIGSQYDDLVARAAQNNKSVAVYAENEQADLVLKGATWNLYNFTLGDASSYGRLVIDEGTTVTVSHSFASGRVQNPKNARVEIKTGGVLNVVAGDEALPMFGQLGNYGSGRAVHDLIVDGGTLTSPNAYLTIGCGVYSASLNLSAGKVAAKGVYVRRGASKTIDKGGATTLSQTGGELEIGATGLCTETTQLIEPRPRAYLESGSLKATADFSTTEAKLPIEFGTLRRAGEYAIDLNGFTVNWNAPLAGVSAVTLGGAGQFKSSAAYKGVPRGLWTVGAPADLSGAAGFAGGLSLVENARAKIDIAGDSIAEQGVFLKENVTNLAGMKAYAGPYHAYTDDMRSMHTGSPEYGSNFYVAYRGRFFVTAEQAGTWYFAGAVDEILSFAIDGEGVLEHENKPSPAVTGSRELAAGWHSFLVIAGNVGSGYGSFDSGSWKGKTAQMALGWTTDPTAEDSTDSSKYRKFAPTTLRMDLGLARWQHDTRATSSTDDLSDWMETTTTYNGFDRLMIASVKDFICAHDSADLDATRNRLSGYVYIPTAGTWKVRGRFDDKFCLRVDGAVIVSSNTHTTEFGNENVPLTEGWHFFDIQVADTYGAQGATYDDALGQTCAVAFCAPGDDRYLAFTEDNFEFAAEKPGLGGVTTLAAGAELTNDAEDICPIWGTLAGKGALEGKFAFTKGSAWQVRLGAAKARTEVADVSGVTNNDFLKALGRVEVVLTARPLVSFYPLCDAGSLTAAEAAGIRVVTSAEAENVEARQDWTATVRGGLFGLVNPNPEAIVIMIR